MLKELANKAIDAKWINFNGVFYGNKVDTNNHSARFCWLKGQLSWSEITDFITDVILHYSKG